MPFHTVLIANRGEIARRVIRTCHAMGYRTVAVYSEADAAAAFVQEADEGVLIGPAPAAQSYLAIDRVLEAARRCGAGAIHPGFGFLSENAAFARACEEAGVVFVGPTSATIAAMGSKIEAKRLMTARGVPVIPGYDGDAQDTPTLAARTLDVGFPALLKASAGGGGKGMRVVAAAEGLEEAIDAARREAIGAFGDGTLLIERYVERPRHIEFQILGDGQGGLIHLGERECSIQRRHQKVVEETPSTALDADLRERMAAAALAAGRALDYRSAGTVEFILAPDGSFYFLEMNTRLQVEHPVTELVTGQDLVRLQLLVAAGQPLPLRQEDVRPRGHAIECRIYAEDTTAGFLPATGTLVDWQIPPLEGLRVDSGVEAGDEVSVHYDPMLAKFVTWGSDRLEATRRMARALARSSLLGVTSNRELLLEVMEHPAWAAGDLHTHFLEEHHGAHGAHDPEAFVRAAIAATVARTADRAARRGALPGLAPGWRNSRWRDAEERWRLGEETLEVRYRWTGAARLVVTVAGEACDVHLLRAEAPAWSLAIGGHARTFRVATDPSGRVWVHDGRTSLALQCVPRFPETEVDVVAGGCRAPMPGKVLDVRVSVGDAVAAGDTLVLLEAMKMEHSIVAPAEGVVLEVLAAMGETVDADAALVVLGPTPPVQ